MILFIQSWNQSASPPPHVHVPGALATPPADDDDNDSFMHALRDPSRKKIEKHS